MPTAISSQHDRDAGNMRNLWNKPHLAYRTYEHSLLLFFFYVEWRVYIHEIDSLRRRLCIASYGKRM